jgi:hypothetical protein
VLDFLHFLQRAVDGGFVGQKCVGDVEVALFFGADRWHPVQGALIAPVVGPAGARFQASDVALSHGVGIFPQRKDRQLLDVEAQAYAELTAAGTDPGRKIPSTNQTSRSANLERSTNSLVEARHRAGHLVIFKFRDSSSE